MYNYINEYGDAFVKKFNETCEAYIISYDKPINSHAITFIFNRKICMDLKCLYCTKTFMHQVENICWI